MRGDRDPIDIDWQRPWLAARAERDPDRVALVADGRETTFAELAAGARSFASVLRARGVGRGARVALLLGGTRDFVELVHACQDGGAVAAPLSTRLTGPELAIQIARLRPTVVIHDAARAALAAEAVRDLDGVAVLDANADFDTPAAAGEGCERGAGGMSAAATIVFTSGTAATPKGVILSAANHLASARGVLANLGVTRDDRWLVPLPLYHVGGLAVLFRSVLVGFALVLDDADAVISSAASGARAPTIVSLVPTMLARLLDGGERVAASAARLPTIVLGGGACPSTLLERAARAGFDVVTSYGMTETGSQVTATAHGEYPGAGASAGRPLLGVELRIVEPGRRGYGEILVRAPQVMVGYLGDAAATAHALQGGWLHTGDIGRIDDAGRLHVATRRDDLIVTGGENVVPEEVENALLAHPAVAQACVFGRPDERWGQRVAAVIVPVEGVRLDPAELTRWCRARLAPYKIPRSLEVASALPTTVTGKLLRRRL